MALFSIINASTVRDGEKQEIDLGKPLAPGEISDPSQLPDTVLFNVSGQRFAVPRTILDRAPAHSPLRCLHTDLWTFDVNSREFIIDRNPQAFFAILVYLHSFQLHLPAGMCRTFFEEELVFYGFQVSHISHCCRRKETSSERRRREWKSARSRALRDMWKRAAWRALAWQRVIRGQEKYR